MRHTNYSLGALSVVLPLLMIAPAAFAATPPGPVPTYTVTIDAYVDGQPATADSTGNASFLMNANWNAKNLGPAGSGQYSLSSTGFNSDTPYEAVTAQMNAGSRYETNPDLSWKRVDGSLAGNGVVAVRANACRLGTYPFVYLGYTTGSTRAEAEAATPVTGTRPIFTNLSENKFVIEWMAHCLNTPVQTSPRNGATVASSTFNQITWNPVTDLYGTVNYYYEVSNSKDRNVNEEGGAFVSPVYQSGPLSSPSIDVSGTPPGTYYWHVMAKDSAGNTSAWSPAWQINVN